nr:MULTISPECIES: peptidase [unclassified Serratia (in: enterobacteria)]
MMLALIALCLLAQLTGCGTTRTVYVPVPAVPLPTELTSTTPIPDIPPAMTWSHSLALNAELIGLLGQCNRDKRGIRAIEDKRNGS